MSPVNTISRLSSIPERRLPRPHAAGSMTGHLSDLLRLMSGGPCDLDPQMDIPVPLRCLRAGDMLFHEGGPAEALYFVRSGTFKTFRTAEDGYEQVLGFSGRAELIGFDAYCMGQHPTSCQALEDSSLYTLLMRDYAQPGSRIEALDRMMALSMSRALLHRGDVTEVMAAVAAEVRLARFVLQLSHRMVDCGQSPRRFHLRMGRRDIASYLGLAHETVSRSFQTLARWQLLNVNNREVEIIDMDGLKALARNTRRQVDEVATAAGAPPLRSSFEPDGSRAAA